MNQRKKIDLLVDLQYGSTGKGLASSYLCSKHYYDLVISANLPNAGHSAYDKNGAMFMQKALPSGVFGNPEFVAIGPGGVFDPDRLHLEIDKLLAAGHLSKTTIVIHDNAVPLTPDMKAEEEQSGAKTIASTLQGSMVASVRKMVRDNTKKVIARDAYDPRPDLNIRMVNSHEWLDMVSDSNRILAEGAQGYSLGLNQSFYPHVTSRDCTTARFLADMALPVGMLSKVIGVARTFPIRVGNTANGHSGGHYADQKELSWAEVGQQPELTTVTGRVRRVFSFSREQLAEAIVANSVDEVFLNFMNYTVPNDSSFADYVSDIVEKCGSKLAYLGYGPRAGDVATYHR